MKCLLFQTGSRLPHLTVPFQRMGCSRCSPGSEPFCPLSSQSSHSLSSVSKVKVQYSDHIFSSDKLIFDRHVSEQFTGAHFQPVPVFSLSDRRHDSYFEAVRVCSKAVLRILLLIRLDTFFRAIPIVFPSVFISFQGTITSHFLLIY